MSTPKSMPKKKLDELAHKLAGEYAKWTIIGNCPSFGKRPVWYHLDIEPYYPSVAKDVAQAVLYLDARGLLIRSPKDPYLVRIKS